MKLEIVLFAGTLGLVGFWVSFGFIVTKKNWYGTQYNHMNPYCPVTMKSVDVNIPNCPNGEVLWPHWLLYRKISKMRIKKIIQNLNGKAKNKTGKMSIWSHGFYYYA